MADGSFFNLSALTLMMALRAADFGAAQAAAT